MTLLPSRHPYLSVAVLSTALIMTATLAGCNNTSSTSPVVNHTPSLPSINTPKAATLSPAVASVIGDYVSSGYAKREEGYDWVAVLITANESAHGTEQINIKVRARSDIKKPTCSFDGQATLMGQDNAHGIIFATTANNSKVFLQFKGGKLIIDSEDQYALNYYCSGGGSLVGDYQKLAGKIELN